MNTTQKVELLGSLVRSLIATDNDGPRLIAEVLRDEPRICDELGDGTMDRLEAENSRLRSEIAYLKQKIASAVSELEGLTDDEDEEE